MQISVQALVKRPICLLALGLGAGLLPKAPGTFGTLIALPFYYVIQHWSLASYLIVIAIAFISGIWICQIAVDWLQQDDPSVVVWDEIVGYLVTMTAAPTGWQWMLAGFILFRFFDIIKPWPVGWIDKTCHGGFGIMLDDIIAGIFAALLLQLLYVLLAASALLHISQ